MKRKSILKFKKIAIFGLVLIFVLLMPLIIKALAFNNIVVISYGGSDNDYFNSVTNSYDSNGNIDGYVAAGYITSDDIEGITRNGYGNEAIIVKYDLNNKLIWQKNCFDDKKSSYSEEYQFYKVINSYDSNNKVDGYIAIGTGSYSALIVKYDLDGKVVWKADTSKMYAGSLLYSIVTSYDSTGKVDGYVVSGYGSAIAKFDLDGKMLWTKTFKGSSYYDVLNSITNSYDSEGNIDGYLAVGSFQSTDIAGLTNLGGDDSRIIKVDLEGNLVWQKNYGGSGSDYFSSVINSYDSNNKIDGYITVGQTRSTDISGIVIAGSADGIMVKYDLDGKVVWQKNYASNNLAGYNDIILAYDNDGKVANGYVVVGYDNLKGIVVKYDLAGNVVLTGDYLHDKMYNTDYQGICYNKQLQKYFLAGTDGTLIVTYSGSMPINNVYDNAIVATFKEPVYPIVSEAKEGKVEVDEEARAGTTVELRIIPNDGYAVDKVVVTDAKGNVIPITNNTFIMPASKVTVVVTYKALPKTNPSTGNYIYYIMLGLTIMLALATYLVSKYKFKNKEDICK
jgi:hypothetical protein